MADEDLQTAAGPEESPAERRHPGRTAAKWAGIVVGVLLLLVAALYFGINTDAGRRYVTRQINQLEFASGLDIDIGRIEGSLYGELVIHDLVLRDTKGIFFAAPRAELDWQPFAYLNNHIDISELVIPTARLRRLPVLNPSADPDAPLLPDIDIDIDRLEIGRLQVDSAVTGQRHLLSIEGQAAIADGRAQIAGDVRALSGPGIAGGDRLVLRLDAVPEQNRFDIEARLQAPANGFVAGMAGLDRPLAATISGAGSWQDWRGRAVAMLGGERIATLAVTGRDGTFNVDGQLRPGLILEGPVARLTAPFVQVNLVTSLSERRADMRLRLRSQALAVAMDGLIDLGQNQFRGVRVAARLLQPGAIAPDLRARDLSLALVLNGPFATPRIAYELQAAALGFGETTLEGVRARGAARIDTDRMLIPVSAQVRRITGLNQAVGGLLTNVSLSGTFAISGATVLADDLRIRSDRINATAVIVANLERGEYRAALQGRIDNYLVEGIGILDITSNFDLVSTASGFGIEGRVAIRTRRIDNESARGFLGGNAVASANISVGSDGTIRFDRLRLSSPLLQIHSGSGTYRPNGQIDIRAAAVSETYGPLTVFVTGTVTQPQVRLRAESPGFGIGLANVDAEIRATGRGYAITATGDSQYGPFSADIEILSGTGPLTAQVNLVRFAGIDFRGRVVQTPAGPFAGTLTMEGSGLSGTVRLAAAGNVQRADISARANGARIPGEPPILIQRGVIDATIILYPDAPLITGDAQLAGVRRGELLIEEARARINYRGGRGQAQLVAVGNSGVPFRVAVNAALSPDRIRANAQGSVNRIAFRLAQPADIRKVGDGWQLAPATIVLPQGNVRLAGRFGDDGLVLQSRIDDLDLSIANVFSPGLGLGGSLSGSLDFSQPTPGSFPRADARLSIDDFTRTGIATRSAPVDIAFVGALRPEGGSASAVIRRGGAVIGRMQARLQPLSPAAGSWTTRLLASPLSGGIRYNGPAEVLWSLTGIADQQLSGPIGIAADFSGRVQDPRFTGVIRANALRFEDETLGTRITNIALQGRFDRSTLEVTQLSGRAGDGTISGRGRVGLASDAGFPIDIRLVLDDARLARSQGLDASVSGEVAVTNSAGEGAWIRGDLRLPEVRYEIVMQGAAEVAELEGVRRRGEPLRPPDEVNRTASAPSIWNLDLRVRADNEVFVSGMGLESEWETDLRVTGTSGSPVVTGTAEVIRGTYSFAGNRFTLDNGTVTFTGGEAINPALAISASTEADDVTITINVTGRALDPNISFSSVPALPQDEILARLLFGGPITELSALQVVQLGASLNSLRGGGGGLNPLGQLRSATGIERLRILGADEASGRGTAISAGFYISNDIYLEVITDARGFTATQLEIALSKSLSILSQAGGTGQTNVNVRYSKDY